MSRDTLVHPAASCKSSSCFPPLRHVGKAAAASRGHLVSVQPLRTLKIYGGWGQLLFAPQALGQLGAPVGGGGTMGYRRVQVGVSYMAAVVMQQ